MQQALVEADRAASFGEVPIGCVLVDAHGQRIASGHNLREATSDPTAHAEVVAIRDASRRAKSWRLDHTTLYVTLEPCAMCAGAIIQSRIRKVVFGCADPKAGACVSLYSLGTDGRLNHRFESIGGVLAEQCAQRLSSFFAALRAQGKK
jgi:tRNA(adenine34) deaminase